SRGRETARKEAAGMDNVNEVYPASWGSVAAPAGGVKASGLGHRHAIEGIHQFMHTHTTDEPRPHPIAPPRGLEQERVPTLMAAGLGHRHGIEGIHQFMHTHTIAEQRLHPIAPSGGLDQERFAALMTGALSVMRALRMR